MPEICLAAFLGALALSAVLTPLARRLALAANLVARVRPDRLHREARPYGGGLAVAAALALLGVPAYLFMATLGRPLSDAGGPEMMLPLALGAAMFFAIGVLDDRFAFAAPLKLALQTVAAGIVVFGLGIKATVWLDIPYAPEAVSILWILAVVNAYNMLDHADGLAAAVGIVALAALGVGQALMGQLLVPLLAFLAAGALAGFLIYNFPSAKLFMGDAGSMLVGYLLAALTMEARYYFPDVGTSRFVVLLPLAILAVPLFDMVCVILARLKRHESPFKGDAASHLAHRMLARGVNPRVVVLFAAGAAVLTGAASIAMYHLQGWLLLGAWLVVAAALAAVWVARRPGEEKGPGPFAREVLSEQGPGSFETRASWTLFRVAPSPETVGRILRRAVVVLGAVGILILPQFSTNASFLPHATAAPVFVGLQGLPGPMTVLLVGLGFLLMPILLVASWVAEGRARLAHAWLTVPVVLFVVGAAVSTGLAADKSSALVRAAELSGLWVGFWALVQAIRSDGERRFLLVVLVAAALIAGIEAIEQQAIGLDRTMAYFQEHRTEVLARLGIAPDSMMENRLLERFTGGVQATLGHPNVLAAFLLLGALVGCGLIREKWSEAASRGARGLTLVLVPVVMACTLALFFTQSRGGLAALAVGLYWLAVAWWIRRRRLRIVLYVVPLVVAAAGVAVAASVDHPAVDAALKSLRYRLDYWQAALEILKGWGLAGVGLENFGLHYTEFKVPWAPEEIRDPHNFFLSVWSQLGLAGLAALVSLIVVAIFSWRRAEGLPGPAAPTDSGEPAAGAAGEFRAAGTARRGESLLGLLAPTVVLAGPGVLFCVVSTIWWPVGVAGVAFAVMLMGLASAEEPSRLEVSGRPLQAVAGACIVALAAFLLMEQIGTAVLEPPTLWAILVVLGVSLGAPGASREASAAEATVPGVRLGLAAKFLLMVLVMIAGFAYVKWLLIPVQRERALLIHAAESTEVYERDESLRAAGEANPLAWEPPFIRGQVWQSEAVDAASVAERVSFIERAMADYADAVARQPRLRQAYLALAASRLSVPGALQDASALREALGYTQEASRLYPNDIQTQLQLASLEDRLGEGRRALAGLRRALELDDLMPQEDRRLPVKTRAMVESRIKQLEESLAKPGQAK